MGLGGELKDKRRDEREAQLASMGLRQSKDALNIALQLEHHCTKNSTSFS